MPRSHPLLIMIFLSLYLCSQSTMAEHPTHIPILTYHNFDPTIPGSMTISTAKFAEQLKWIKDNGYTVIPLKEAVSYLQGKIDSLPSKAIVITADDGREPVYTYMLPLIQKYQFPVTLFVYPSAISHAKYALTWDQLKTLQKTGLFDIQCHTYWHPNFNQERKRLSAAEYEKLVHVQLVTAKKVLADKLGKPITLLAWPYGIYDNHLEEQAANAGYTMAFSIDGRRASKTEKTMSQPRFMVNQGDSFKTFASMMNGNYGKHLAKN